MLLRIALYQSVSNVARHCRHALAAGSVSLLSSLYHAGCPANLPDGLDLMPSLKKMPSSPRVLACRLMQPSYLPQTDHSPTNSNSTVLKGVEPPV